MRRYGKEHDRSWGIKDKANCRNKIRNGRKDKINAMEASALESPGFLYPKIPRISPSGADEHEINNVRLLQNENIRGEIFN